jgi:hypothetical protein
MAVRWLTLWLARPIVRTAHWVFAVYVLINGAGFPLAYFMVGPPRGDLWTSVYFSLVTSTTTGYGDITPATFVQQLVVLVQLLCSLYLLVIFLGVVFAMGSGRQIMEGDEESQ